MEKVASFWKSYDIRAVVNADFGPKQYYDIASAYAAFIREALPNHPGAYWVAVGHDVRLHSIDLTEALIQGLTQAGLNVVFLGLSTSPLVYFSEYLHEQKPNFPDLVGTLVVTASHNPSEYNGVKFTFQKRAMTTEEFARVKDFYHHPVVLPGSVQPGQVKSMKITNSYINWFTEQFNFTDAKLKVVVDCGNATAGIVAPEILKKLGCDVVEMFTEPDGRFPNHHPDPCVHKNLLSLTEKVRETQADIGFAFDGDADRVGVVDNLGRILPGDQVTLFIAEDVLKTHPGKVIVFDIKSTQNLTAFVKERGGIPLLAPSGHVLMKRMMKEQDIPLGGELSGHFFFRDRHWGFDDALYAACRLLETLAHHKKEQEKYQFSDFADSLPPSVISEEMRIYCTVDEGLRLMENLQETLIRQPNFFGSNFTEILTMDGVRVNFQGGFFLIRRSGTEPCVTLRFEAVNQESYQQIEKCVDILCQPLMNQV